jgi:DNA adenine methylase
MKSCLKWHGGKRPLASKIVALMPPHTRYVEPYCGSCAVLFAKSPEGVSEYINDADGELMNFWRVIRRPGAFEQLQRMLEATPLSQWDFENASDESRDMYGSDFEPDATKAWRFFVRMRMSRQALGKDYCTPTSRLRRGINEQVSAWLTAIDGLPEIHARLKTVEIWNVPALQIIEKLDSPETLNYIDPPYLAETRSSGGEYGDYEMSESDHSELLGLLTELDGKFLLSGYRSSMYDQWAKAAGWRRIDLDVPNHASGSREKERKTECIWMNY